MASPVSKSVSNDVGDGSGRHARKYWTPDRITPVPFRGRDRRGRPADVVLYLSEATPTSAYNAGSGRAVAGGCSSLCLLRWSSVACLVFGTEKNRGHDADMTTPTIGRERTTEKL